MFLIQNVVSVCAVIVVIVFPDAEGTTRRSNVPPPVVSSVADMHPVVEDAPLNTCPDKLSISVKNCIQQFIVPVTDTVSTVQSRSSVHGLLAEVLPGDEMEVAINVDPRYAFIVFF